MSDLKQPVNARTGSNVVVLKTTYRSQPAQPVHRDKGGEKREKNKQEKILPLNSDNGIFY